jgi:hypothetical protein
MNRMRRLWWMHASLGALAALQLAFCHSPDRPPIPPPKPTDPTSLAARDPAEDVTDASIITDGGEGWDGWKFELDTGASSGRHASP